MLVCDLQEQMLQAQASQTAATALGGSCLNGTTGIVCNSNNNQDLNLSEASGGSAHSDKEPESPEKYTQQHRTPMTEKKKKSKDVQPFSGLGYTGKNTRCRPAVKTNDYFKYPHLPQSTPLPSPLSAAVSSGLDYSMLMAHSDMQTDLTVNKINELENKAAMELKIRENKIEELQRFNKELKKKLQAQQKKLEEQDEETDKCIAFLKHLIMKETCQEVKRKFQAQLKILKEQKEDNKRQLSVFKQQHLIEKKIPKIAVKTTMACEKDIDEVEVVKTVIEIPTMPVRNVVSSSQVQTSVNGAVQNGLATNQFKKQ